jgi:hypothetical protein
VIAVLIALAVVAIVSAPWPSTDAILIALGLGLVADAIRASRPKDWSLAQRVDALSDAYAKGYRDARDEGVGA